MLLGAVYWKVNLEEHEDLEKQGSFYFRQFPEILLSPEDISLFSFSSLMKIR